MKILKYYITLLFLSSFYCQQVAKAVSAYPFKITIKTYNGKNVSIYMQGDENRKFAITEDGYSILNDFDGWWYAGISKDGKVEKTSYRLVSKDDETPELKEFKLSCPKRLIPYMENKSISNRSIRRGSSSTSVPVIGKRKALVILMQYKDVSFSHSLEDFERLFNSPNYNEGGATGSVKDYYLFASQGQLDYESDIYGPFTSVYPMSFYGRNDAMGNDANPLELCKEALANLPNDIDLSIYDNNADGIIDNVHIIYAGYGEEAGATSDAIWAHEYPHQVSINKGISVTVAGYSCSPELRENSNANITRIGVICHELGHALGAMDYYDTDYGTGGEYLGTGNWDIMASGSWNDNGKTPPNFNPYVRSVVFGWNEQMLLSPDTQINMPPMKMENAEKYIVYRMETDCKEDYFLLENRQKYYFDKALPGEGLMIYHVHPNIERYSISNMVNATHPQCLYPVCASGSFPDKKDYGYINSDGCPFPGTKDNSFFSSQSFPSAVAWNGSPSVVSISDICINDVDGSISFFTHQDKMIDPDRPDEPDVDIKLYKESFEQDLVGKFHVESIMGKEIWRTYKKGGFILNPASIPEATDGNNILMLYVPKGENINESKITSKDIQMEHEGDYVLSFDIYCDERTKSQGASFSFIVEEEIGTCVSFSLDKATNGWEKIEIPILLTNKNFRYSIQASVLTGGIFVDNICLMSNNSNGISSVNTDFTDNENGLIYSINGSFIGENNKVNLNPGFYIMYSNGNIRKFFVSK